MSEAKTESEKTELELLQALGEAWDNAAQLRAEIERLRDIIARFLAYQLDEFDVKPEDLERPYEEGLFTRGFWAMLKEAREATKE